MQLKPLVDLFPFPEIFFIFDFVFALKFIICFSVSILTVKISNAFFDSHLFTNPFRQVGSHKSVSLAHVLAELTELL